MNDDSDDYLFEDISKDPGTERRVILDCYSLCASLWVANEEFDADEYVRPTIPTGFSYKAVASLLSGAREPQWPLAIGEVIEDGSGSWVCAAPAANGIIPVVSPTATSDPVGLTISSPTVLEQRKIAVTYSGGTLGKFYDAVFAFTISGLAVRARQRVHIVRQ